ncbi:hypothetical protein KI387_019348, partial [Taxus chinensis]
EKKDDVKENKEAKPEPVVLKVDIHCAGCARKVRKSIKNFKGVEDVEIDMELNMVIVKGNVDPLKLCERVQKKCGKKTEILSPLPKKENKVEEEKQSKKPEPEVVMVVLKVNMDCEGCAQRVQRAIFKMKGVQAVHSDFTNNKVTVKGTMEPKKLVDYLYRRAGKHAQIVPPPQKTEDDTKKEDDKKPAEETKKDEEKKDDGGDKKEGEEKKEEPKPDEKKEGEKSEEGEAKKDGEKVEGEEKKDGEKVEGEEKKDAGDESVKEEEKKDGAEETVVVNTTEEKKYEFSAPKYVIEHVYPPQLFSDENPNACSIM